jgi:hypothetical protein
VKPLITVVITCAISFSLPPPPLSFFVQFQQPYIPQHHPPSLRLGMGLVYYAVRTQASYIVPSNSVSRFMRLFDGPSPAEDWVRFRYSMWDLWWAKCNRHLYRLRPQPVMELAFQCNPPPFLASSGYRIPISYSHNHFILNLVSPSFLWSSTYPHSILPITMRFDILSFSSLPLCPHHLHLRNFTHFTVSALVSYSYSGQNGVRTGFYPSISVLPEYHAASTLY